MTTKKELRTEINSIQYNIARLNAENDILREQLAEKEREAATLVASLGKQAKEINRLNCELIQKEKDYKEKSEAYDELFRRFTKLRKETNSSDEKPANEKKKDIDLDKLLGGIIGIYFG